MDKPSSVEAYLASLPPASREALERLRGIIRSAAPDATEAISYGMPAFKDGKRTLVYYAAFKEHCSLFPGSKQVIADLADELSRFPTAKGTIRFAPDEPLPAALVRKIVRARLRENAQR